MFFFTALKNSLSATINSALRERLEPHELKKREDLIKGCKLGKVGVLVIGAALIASFVVAGGFFGFIAAAFFAVVTHDTFRYFDNCQRILSDDVFRVTTAVLSAFRSENKTVREAQFRGTLLAGLLFHKI